MRWRHVHRAVHAGRHGVGRRAGAGQHQDLHQSDLFHVSLPSTDNAALHPTPAPDGDQCKLPNCVHVCFRPEADVPRISLEIRANCGCRCRNSANLRSVKRRRRSSAEKERACRLLHGLNSHGISQGKYGYRVRSRRSVARPMKFPWKRLGGDGSRYLSKTNKYR